MVEVFHSKDQDSVERCILREYGQWPFLEEITFPDDLPTLPDQPVEDHDFTWEVRRLAVRPLDDFTEVQNRWEALRSSQGWSLEQAMIRTARFYVKRVLL